LTRFADDIADLEAVENPEGWDEETGCGCCPCCERLYSSNGGYVGEVYRPDARRWEHYYESPAGEGPYLCPDCWDEHGSAIAKAAIGESHRTLDEFADGGAA